MMNDRLDLPRTTALLDALKALGVKTVTRRQVVDAAEALGDLYPRWYVNGGTFSVGRGLFRVATLAECQKAGVGYVKADGRGRKPGRAPKVTKVAKTAKVAVAPVAAVVPDVASLVSEPAPLAMTARVAAEPVANATFIAQASAALGVDVMLASAEHTPTVPAVAKTYVPTGHFETVKKFVASQEFTPFMVVGPSGNGKSEMIEQVCATLGRTFIRVNITKQTDEDDLIGGFRLVNGETKFALGPVPIAMMTGTFMNLDEIDLGGAALMALQAVLEGKPLYIKKIGRYIHPAPGFGIGATANTKGRGDDGRYMHTGIMNDAMLERFTVMFEQGWPEAAIERKILGLAMKSRGVYDAKIAKHLVDFANATRANFEQQVCSDEIATRRLLHIVKTFAILGNITEAVNHAMTRFDAGTADGFKKLWLAIHDDGTESTPSGQTIPNAPPAGF